jgi:hypothetical protein
VKRSLLVFGFGVLMLASLVPSIHAMALDSEAKSKFQSSVSGAGGSNASSLPDLVKSSITILLYAAGVIAVIVIIIGAIRFVTSEGDSAAATKARNTVIYAAVGLVLAVLAYALVNFILKFA